MILLVDNNDSYTYNLYQLLSQLTDEEVTVIEARDVVTSGRVPRLVRGGHFSRVVISPGPGHPGRARDFAGSRVIIDAARGIPLLGVCLGHQGLGLSHGARVINAPQAKHGFVSLLTHTGRGLFAGIPQDFRVVRYHSLHVVDESHLDVHARSEDGLVMAFHVPGQPHWGVQFHPESILTEHGDQLLTNFLQLPGNRLANVESELLHTSSSSTPPNRIEPHVAGLDKGNGAFGESTNNGLPRPIPGWSNSKKESTAATDILTLHAKFRSFAVDLNTEVLFHALAAQHPGAPLFWIDPDQTSGNGSRYTIMGAADGPNSQTIRYHVEQRKALIRTGNRTEERHDVDIFALLKERIANTKVRGLPANFPFGGGYLGYFGYELKSLILGPNRHRADTPDAYWLRPESFILYDHKDRQAHAVWMGGDNTPLPDRAEIELAKLARIVREATTDGAERKHGKERNPLREWQHNPDGKAEVVSNGDDVNAADEPPKAGAWRLSHGNYIERIEKSQRLLRAGESYEICLTDQFVGDGDLDGLAYYCELRRVNPAPHAAYFRFPEFGDRIEIMCASPERFLTIDADHMVESKPIKGTAPRSPNPQADDLLKETLRSDPKTRAENLMIVDLLRNDLGRVCETGSVRVPQLMSIESYPAVHQLVSTIRGRLLPELDALDAVRASFPGGSMTGAPKKRTAEIIDALEAGARGIYSGSIGYLAFDGRADLNIAIRTLVRHGDGWSIGAGGAVVLDSDPHAEHEEKNLKAEKLVSVLHRMVDRSPNRHVAVDLRGGPADLGDGPAHIRQAPKDSGKKQEVG